MRTLLSTSKLEGFLKAMKIEISQIPITDNIPPNLSSGERKALQEIIGDKDQTINKGQQLWFRIEQILLKLSLNNSMNQSQIVY